MSASQKKPWRRFIKRDTLQGGGRGNKGKPLFRGEAAYVGRLRRLETVVLVLTMKLKIPPKVLDGLLENMLSIADVDEPTGSGTEVQGNSVPLPHEGAPGGEAEGEG